MLTWTRPIRQLRASFIRRTASVSHSGNVAVSIHRELRDGQEKALLGARSNMGVSMSPTSAAVFSTCCASTVRDAPEESLLSQLEQEGLRLHQNGSLLMNGHSSFASKGPRLPSIPDSFLELCRRRSSLLQGLSPNAVKSLVANTEASQMNKVVSKLSSLYRYRLDSDDMDMTSVQIHFDAIQSTLEHLLINSLANAKHIIQLFEITAGFCDKYGLQPHLTPKSFSALAKIMSSRSESWYVLNTTVIDSFVGYIQSLQLEWPGSQKGQHTLQKPHRDVWWDVFVLVKILLDRGQHKVALSTIQVLLERDVIPAQAIDDAIAVSHFRDFGISVLVRSCAYLHWAEGAARLLATENFSDVNLLSHYSALINEVISTLLEGKSKASEHCAYIISHAWLREPRIAIEQGLTQSVLVKCRENSLVGAAEALLSALYDPRVRQHQKFRPTAPSNITWLLHHLVDKRRNKTVGRLLVRDLISSKTPIEARMRPNVIAMCAEGGFHEEVLELWKRYSDGPEAKLVTGHARCMLAVVKLFGTKSDTIYMASDSETGLSAPMRASTSTSSANECVSMPPKDDTNDNLSETFEGTESARASPRTSRVPDPPRVETGFSGASLGAVGGAADDVSRTQGYGRSNYAFALRVLDAFRDAKEPLHKASHYDLNVFARASTFVGNYRQGMLSLQILLQRREIPDQHDLHILISIMARNDLRAASSLLMDLLKQGARADSPILSAVILGAVRQDEKQLAVAIYERLLSLGRNQGDMSPEAIGALLKIFLELSASAGAKSADPSQFRRWALQRTRELISDDRLQNVSFPSGLIGRAVHTILAAGEFEDVRSLWKVLSKNRGRKTLRLEIVEGVRKAIAERIIEQIPGRHLLKELGDEG